MNGGVGRGREKGTGLDRWASGLRVKGGVRA